KKKRKKKINTKSLHSIFIFTGEESVRVLVKHGAKIVFSARDLTAAEKVVAKIKAEIPSAEITYYKLDLSSLVSVKAFAEEVKTSGVQLNGLILNAGTMATPFGKTVDGFETQFGTNHVAHYLLTRLLIDNLVANDPARVVVLSSIAHARDIIRSYPSYLLSLLPFASPAADGVVFSDPNFTTRPYDKWEAYGQSKTANILFAYELNKLYASKGVEAFSVHPGGIRTPLQRHIDMEEFVSYGWVDAEGNLDPTVWKTVPKGAATQIWAISAPELKGKGGVYLEDVRVSSPTTEKAKDPKAAERLWSISEEYVKKYL
ncbi:oxidoreductase, partial [Jimgerdemannia flammicorona]